MKLFLCRWPNGDLSIAAGRTLEEIDDVLDEVGDGHAAELIPVTSRFAVHFRLKRKTGEAGGISDLLKLEQFDEASDDRLNDAYPLLAEAFHDAFMAGHYADESPIDEEEAFAHLITALAAERKRDMDPEKQQALHSHCCYGSMTEIEKELMRHGTPGVAGQEG